MSIATMPLAGSLRVIVVGASDFIVRGRLGEYRHHGLALVPRDTALNALLELGKEPDAVVLVPTTLADMPLLEFVDVLRSVAHVPVIAGLAADHSPHLVSELFDHGIAATVALPATPARLAEAIRSVRMPQPVAPAALQVGDLVLDDACYRVTWRGETVPLAPRSFALLRFLMTAHPRIVPMNELIAEFKDVSPDPGMSTRVAIGRLRAALHAVDPDSPSPIETVPKVGYRLIE